MGADDLRAENYGHFEKKNIDGFRIHHVAVLRNSVNNLQTKSYLEPKNPLMDFYGAETFKLSFKALLDKGYIADEELKKFYLSEKYEMPLVLEKPIVKTVIGKEALELAKAFTGEELTQDKELQEKMFNKYNGGSAYKKSKLHVNIPYYTYDRLNKVSKETWEAVKPKISDKEWAKVPMIFGTGKEKEVSRKPLIQQLAENQEKINRLYDEIHLTLHKLRNMEKKSPYNKNPFVLPNEKSEGNLFILDISKLTWEEFNKMTPKEIIKKYNTNPINMENNPTLNENDKEFHAYKMPENLDARNMSQEEFATKKTEQHNSKPENEVVSADLEQKVYGKFTILNGGYTFRTNANSDYIKELDATGKLQDYKRGLIIEFLKKTPMNDLLRFVDFNSKEIDNRTEIFLSLKR